MASPSAKLFAASTGPTQIATLPGTQLPLTIREFPASMTGRARVATSNAAGGQLRIEGWLELKALRFFAPRDLPIIDGHLWLSQGQLLILDKATEKGFSAKHSIAGSTDSAKDFSLPCSAVSLCLPRPLSPAPPEKARTYSTRSSEIDLYDEPGGSLVTTRHFAESSHKLLWSTERASAG